MSTVLQRHGVVERTADGYALRPEVSALSGGETDALVGLCDAAVDAYKTQRGEAILEHRAVSLGVIPGRLRSARQRAARDAPPRSGGPRRDSARRPSAAAFNVGVNAGAVAGQTVAHCHIHLIPRRQNDVPNPRGGVRGIVPGMAEYEPR